MGINRSGDQLRGRNTGRCDRRCFKTVDAILGVINAIYEWGKNGLGTAFIKYSGWSGSFRI